MSECPYLNTIHLDLLDFDLEKTCSVSLSNINIYCCLTCGKYFQGKGSGSPASLHSINQDHRVFLSVDTGKFYCLPEDYLVKTCPILKRIRLALFPDIDIAELHDRSILDFNASHTDQVIDPNSPQSNNYMLKIESNGTGAGLAKIADHNIFLGMFPLNFIKHSDYINVVIHSLLNVSQLKSYLLSVDSLKDFPLLNRIQELCKKMYNRHALKPFINPHELVQTVAELSGKKFTCVSKRSPQDFMNWIIYFLRKENPALIDDLFRGYLQVNGKSVPFYHLQIDIPYQPVLLSEKGRGSAPQFLLHQLIADTYAQQPERVVKLLQEPKYLIIFYRRNVVNQWKDLQVNHAIVNFPLKDMPIPIVNEGTEQKGKYQLICNILQEFTESNQFQYRCQLLHKLSGNWVQLNGLKCDEIFSQTIFLAESIIQIWERLN